MSSIGLSPALPPVSAYAGRLASIPSSNPVEVSVRSTGSVGPAAGATASTMTATTSQLQPVTATAATETETPEQAEAEQRRQVARVEAELLRVTQAEIRELASRDREVRAHEQAHLAVGGQYAGPVRYDYAKGPDGRMYAVGGSVSIDTAPIPGDPAATLQKLQQVQRAALAPAQPSAQDLKVAAQAAQSIAQARAELATEALDGDEGEASVATSAAGDTAEQSDAQSTNRDAERGLALYRQVGAGETPAAGMAAQA
ncbi:MAG: putative metalloprotease CJM1_0395 family protein [Pseudomonas sp.]